MIQSKVRGGRDAQADVLLRSVGRSIGRQQCSELVVTARLQKGPRWRSADSGGAPGCAARLVRTLKLPNPPERKAHYYCDCLRYPPQYNGDEQRDTVASTGFYCYVETCRSLLWLAERWAKPSPAHCCLWGGESAPPEASARHRAAHLRAVRPEVPGAFPALAAPAPAQLPSNSTPSAGMQFPGSVGPFHAVHAPTDAVPMLARCLNYGLDRHSLE